MEKNGVLYLINILMILAVLPRISSDCALSPPLTEILETDNTDIVLLEFPITLGESWVLEEPRASSYIQLNTSNSYFSLTLLRAIDLETLLPNTTSGTMGNMIKLTLTCSSPGQPPVELPFRIVVKAINEFPPQFIDEPLIASIKEQSPGDSEVIQLLDHVMDRDYGVFQMEGFMLYPYLINAEEDGFDIFYMKGAANGVIGLKPAARLDYETLAKQGRTYFMLNISVQDTGYPSAFTTYSTLRIDVTDVDDNSPVFVYDCPADCPKCPRVNGFCRVHAYSATTSVDGLGPITVYPAPIKAIDPDTLNYTIEYSMTVISIPSSNRHFIINNKTGVVSQVRSLDDLSVTSVRVFLEAKEISPTGYGSTTTFSLEIAIQRPTSFTDPDGSPVEDTSYSDVMTVNTTDLNDHVDSLKEVDTGLAVGIILAIIGGVILVVIFITVIAILVMKSRKGSRVF